MKILIASIVTYLLVALLFYDDRENRWDWLLAPLVLLVPLAAAFGLIFLWRWAI
jgi:hypothetical protein